MNPNRSGYLMPAEWEAHESTWIAWPHNKDHWPGNFDPIPHVYCEIIRALVSSEKVYVCVNDAGMESAATELLFQSNVPLNNVRFFHIQTDASWSRDHGPIFVKDREEKVAITDWIFNAWGRKYPPWEHDDAVPQHVARILELPLIQPGIVLEGGSIDVNGRGTLLTTEQCLLNPNRNPHLRRNQIEQYLAKYLGANHILWLTEGIIGDDTDGHVDDLVRFVNDRTVVCAIEEKKNDENYEILKKNYEDLLDMRDQDGTQLTVVPIPMPEPVIYQGTRLPASYANFYIGNRVVIMPTFRCKQDHESLRILCGLFPDRKVIGIDCVDLVWGLGTLHCLSQQQPA